MKNFFRNYGLWIAIFLVFSLLLYDFELPTEVLDNCIEGSQEIEILEKKVSSFHSINLNLNGKIFVTQGERQRLKIVGAKNVLEDLDIQVQKSKLLISSDNCFQNSHSLEVHLTLPKVQEVSLSGDGSIVSRSLIVSENLTLAINGVGLMNFQLESQTLKTSIVGSTEVQLRGKTKAQHLIVTGSGNINASSLRAESSFISVNGSGDLWIQVSNELQADIHGSARVNYQGTPSILAVKISGVGSVEKQVSHSSPGSI